MWWRKIRIHNKLGYRQSCWNTEKKGNMRRTFFILSLTMCGLLVHLRQHSLVCDIHLWVRPSSLFCTSRWEFEVRSFVLIPEWWYLGRRASWGLLWLWTELTRLWCLVHHVVAVNASQVWDIYWCHVELKSVGEVIAIAGGANMRAEMITWLSYSCCYITATVCFSFQLL